MKLSIKTKAKKKEKQRFALPTAYTEPSTVFEDYNLWIYGVAGIGKTSLTTQFRKPLHWMFEPGAKALRVKPIYPREWERLEKYIEQVEAENDFETNVIDTVEAMYELCWKWASKKYEWEHPSDLPYGKGWDSVRSPFSKSIKRLLNIPRMGTVILSHAKQGTRKTSDGDEFEDIHPNLSGAPLEDVAAAVDIIGYYHRRKGEHVLQIRPTDEVMAKCRLEDNFLYTDGTPIRYIPMGTNKQEAYANLIAAFNNELDRPEERSKKRPKLKKKKR